jgi:hypothetical protein
MRLFATFILSFYIFLSNSLSAQTIEKTRIIVLTDIEADPDDAQSLVRFLLYANQFEVEGLIATTSIHQKKRVAPETIHKILKAYEKVQSNLNKHEAGYPTYAQLSRLVKQGRPEYGMTGVGPENDSEGSEWIISVLEKPDERPLWVTVWGGPNCLAQALWKIKNTRSAEQAEKMIRKLRVYTISDQDDSGPWMRKEFPNLFYVVTPGYTYGYATWRGINGMFDGANNDVISNEWLATHIQQGHGPLGVMYPDVAYGMEGDTPTFLHLIPNGLNTPEHPNYGGWGGRYELYQPTLQKDTIMVWPNWPQDVPETRAIWTNTIDSVQSPMDKKWYASNFATLWRWRAEFQNDFAARMDWCTKPYKEANHPPVPKLAHPAQFTAKSGELFHLNADGTYDPDEDSVSCLWMHYKEAGTLKSRVSFFPYAANIYDLPVTAPKVTKPETLHFILKVTDKGTPALSRYKRVIVTVVP